MTEAEAGAREQLRDTAAELEAIRVRLLGLHLPVTLRSVIECVVTDSLEPAIRDLRREATSPPDSDTTWEPSDV